MRSERQVKTKKKSTIYLKKEKPLQSDIFISAIPLVISTTKKWLKCMQIKITNKKKQFRYCSNDITITIKTVIMTRMQMYTRQCQEEQEEKKRCFLCQSESSVASIIVSHPFSFPANSWRLSSTSTSLNSNLPSV